MPYTHTHKNTVRTIMWTPSSTPSLSGRAWKHPWNTITISLLFNKWPNLKLHTLFTWSLELTRLLFSTEWTVQTHKFYTCSCYKQLASQLDSITFHFQELNHLCHKTFITTEFLFLLSWQFTILLNTGPKKDMESFQTCKKS